MSYIIEDKQIYDSTDNGLTILKELFGNVRPGKNFSERNDDAHPSASLYQHSKTKVWGVNDFAVGKWRDAITVYMEHENVSHYEALLRLAEKYNVPCRINAAINKARYECRTATDADSFSYVAKEKFSASELRLMGPNVTQEHCNMLGWKSLVSYSWVSDGKYHTLLSTDDYPIFMRLLPKAKPEAPQCHKIYQPLQADPNRKHFYLPAGTRPENYINGLAELRKAYEVKNETEKRKWEERELKDGEEQKPYTPAKLPAAVLCSGDRDALCCLSMGMQPIWLNSETAELSASDYEGIMACADKLYNIPDIDETGKRMGKKLALSYPDMLTVWLPDMSKSVKDNRGRQRKDLQGWMELHPKEEEFRQLIKKAMPARFWVCDEKGKPSGLEIDALYYFLALNERYAYKDPNSQQILFVLKNGYKISRQTDDDIRQFVIDWVKNHQYSRALVRCVMQSNYLAEAKLVLMERIDLTFENFTENSQMFFFEDHAVTITADDIKPIRLKDYKSDCSIWDSHIFKHPFKLLGDMFTITYTVDENGKPVFDVVINNVESNFLGYLINSSRLSWRKELEDNLENKSDEDRKSYLAAHKFDIAGDGLTEKEVRDQKMCLLNKLFTLGYLFHQYKSPSRAWAVFSMDNKIGDDDQCNGRTGKSFFFKLLEKVLMADTISGKIKDPTSNKHLYERITTDTRLLIFDDCQKGMRLSDFYDVITGRMTINVKNEKSYNLDFEDSPKIAFTTNYVPKDFDPSTMARLLPMVYSDYYHEATIENDYLESRSVMHDFGHDLYTKNYNEADWNADLNLVLQATRFYLWVMKNWPSMKILPPMENIQIRKYKQDMGENFEQWASIRLAHGSSWLDCEVCREDMFNDYVEWSGNRQITPNGFLKRLRAYCYVSEDIESLNPEDKITDTKRKRITRTVNGKTTEYLYIRSVDAPF